MDHDLARNDIGFAEGITFVLRGIILNGRTSENDARIERDRARRRAFREKPPRFSRLQNQLLPTASLKMTDECACCPSTFSIQLPILVWRWLQHQDSSQFQTESNVALLLLY